MQIKEDVVINLEKKYVSENDFYHKLISIHNVVEDWGLTSTQINILVYLIRLGFTKDTKEIICKNLGISDKSLTTNLSYLRTGRVGKKKIKKLIDTSKTNLNISLLTVELKDIKKIVESKDVNKRISVLFKNGT